MIYLLCGDIIYNIFTYLDQFSLWSYIRKINVLKQYCSCSNISYISEKCKNSFNRITEYVDIDNDNIE